MSHIDIICSLVTEHCDRIKAVFKESEKILHIILNDAPTSSLPTYEQSNIQSGLLFPAIESIIFLRLFYKEPQNNDTIQKLNVYQVNQDQGEVIDSELNKIIRELLTSSLSTPLIHIVQAETSEERKRKDTASKSPESKSPNLKKSRKNSVSASHIAAPITDPYILCKTAGLIREVISEKILKDPIMMESMLKQKYFDPSKAASLVTSIPILRLLVLYGAELNDSNMPGFMKQKNIIHNSLEFAVLIEDEELCQVVLERSPILDIQYALFLAAIKQKTNILHLLLNHATPNFPSGPFYKGYDLLIKILMHIKNKQAQLTAMKALLDNANFKIIDAEFTVLFDSVAGEPELAATLISSKFFQNNSYELGTSIFPIIEKMSGLQFLEFASLSAAIITQPFSNFDLLYYTITNKNEDFSIMLLDHGADPNALYDNGLSPLHLAIMSEQANLVRKLCECGASLLHNSLERDSLWLALRIGNEEIVSIICDHLQKSPVTSKNSIYSSLSCSLKRNDIAYIKTMFKYIKPAQLQHIIDIKLFLLATARGNLEAIKLFLEVNIDLANQRDIHNFSAADVASLTNNYDIIYFFNLINLESDELHTNSGRTEYLFGHPIASNDIAHLKFLIAFLSGDTPHTSMTHLNLDPNYCFQPTNMSLLMIAALHGSEKMVRFLLLNNADPHSIDSKNRTALDYAMVSQDATIINLFRSRGCLANHDFIPYEESEDSEPEQKSKYNPSQGPYFFSVPIDREVPLSQDAAYKSGIELDINI